jgi:hypothetical protein
MPIDHLTSAASDGLSGGASLGLIMLALELLSCVAMVLIVLFWPTLMAPYCSELPDPAEAEHPDRH